MVAEDGVLSVSVPVDGGLWQSFRLEESDYNRSPADVAADIVRMLG